MTAQTELFDSKAFQVGRQTGTRFTLQELQNISDYKENHGESSSIESEARRKALRSGKVKAVIQLMKAKDGRTAGEMWNSHYFEISATGSVDIYDLRRTLSMMKSAGIIYSGAKRPCKAFSTSEKTINTFPWFLVNV